MNQDKLDYLTELVKDFCEKRDWDQFHNAKDLAIGIITEGSELIEHFRFKSNSEIEAMFEDECKRKEIEYELIDVLYFVIRFSQMYDIDILSAFEEKMRKNKLKYPVDEFKGCNKKYNED
ncbi:MAG: nucleotide pyrophosphohydrolase [archaeon]